MAKMKLLYAEGEVEVLTAQAAVFEKAGHEVERAVGRKGVLESVKKAKFDLVVLGPSLTRNDRHHLVYMVKEGTRRDAGAGDAFRRRTAPLRGPVHGDGREPVIGGGADCQVKAGGSGGGGRALSLTKLCFGAKLDGLLHFCGVNRRIVSQVIKLHYSCSTVYFLGYPAVVTGDQ
jgi:hypothetical protein